MMSVTLPSQRRGMGGRGETGKPLGGSNTVTRVRTAASDIMSCNKKGTHRLCNDCTLDLACLWSRYSSSSTFSGLLRCFQVSTRSLVEIKSIKLTIFGSTFSTDRISILHNSDDYPKTSLFRREILQQTWMHASSLHTKAGESSGSDGNPMENHD